MFFLIKGEKDKELFTLIFLTNQSHPADLTHAAVWTQYHTWSTGSANSAAVELLVHLTRWLASNYGQGQKWVIIMRWCRACDVASQGSVFPTSSWGVKRVFHTTWACRMRRVQQGWWALPVWLVTSNRWTWDKATSGRVWVWSFHL